MSQGSLKWRAVTFWRASGPHFLIFVAILFPDIFLKNVASLAGGEI